MASIDKSRSAETVRLLVLLEQEKFAGVPYCGDLARGRDARYTGSFKLKLPSVTGAEVAKVMRAREIRRYVQYLDGLSRTMPG